MITLYQKRAICLAIMRGNLMMFRVTKNELYFDLAMKCFDRMIEISEEIKADQTVTYKNVA